LNAFLAAFAMATSDIGHKSQIGRSLLKILLKCEDDHKKMSCIRKGLPHGILDIPF